MMVDKLLMGFPQKAAGSNPAGGTLSTSGNGRKSTGLSIRYPSGCHRWPNFRLLACLFHAGCWHHAIGSNGPVTCTLHTPRGFAQSAKLGHAGGW
jgi:hypothetical protein